MILNFQPRDIETFEARFNKHLLEIHKRPDGFWQLFVNGDPVRGGKKESPRKCMDVAERAAQNVISASLEETWQR